MAFPVAAGAVEHSGVMIPELWSGLMIQKYYDETCLPKISNTDYEGEIKSQGDTVNIRTTPTITINDHVKGQKLDFEDPEPELVTLLIDKGKSWSFKASNIDKAQADYDFIADWDQDAGEQMQITIETDVFADVYADAHAGNKGATAGVKSGSIDLGYTTAPEAVTKDNITDYIVDLDTVLNEQNLPKSDRWIVLPHWVCGLIFKSELQEADRTGDDTSILRSGQVGTIRGFTVYSSNLLSTVVDTVVCTNCIFGHKSAITFATQMVENKGPMERPDYFGEFYRGLQIYGYKVIKPEALGHFYIKKG